MQRCNSGFCAVLVGVCDESATFSLRRVLRFVNQNLGLSHQAVRREKMLQLRNVKK
jgi:hypothetical protein